MKFLIFPIVIIAIMIACSGKDIKKPSQDFLNQLPPGDTPSLFAPGTVSVPDRFDYGISFSPDGKELAFGILDMSDVSGQIYYSRKIKNKWTEPDLCTFLGDGSVFLPFYTPDGKSLLYTMTQPDSATYITDIWMVNREKNGWSEPIRQNDTLNSPTREGSVCMTLNKTIYFSSGRNCMGVMNCPAEIYYAEPNEGRYNHVEKDTCLNISGDKESIFVAPDGSYALISNVTRSMENADLYISYRIADHEWSAPQKLDSTINSDAWEMRPFVSNDNKYLFFTRLIFDKQGPVESDIYWVSMEKLLKPLEKRELLSEIKK